MTELKTYRTKENGFLIILIRINQTKNLVFLLDPWKAGYRDFESHKGSISSLKREIGMPSIKFYPISKKEAATFLRRGIEIADAVGVEIGEDAKSWFEKLGVYKIKPKGSLYKCFNCEEGELSQDDVEEILEIARKEVEEGIVGTDQEEQYFYICENCRQDMHESHTNGIVN